MFRTILATLALMLATPALAQHHGHQGDIAATGGFARATLPNAPVGGAYVTLANNSGQDDRLLSVTTPAAGEVQIHDMAMDGDMMKMVPLPDGVPLPAGDTVVFGPSGKHIMLMDLREPLVEGETIDLTLTFERADPLTVTLPVGPINADGAPAHHHH